jgi:hypothetical protein
MSDDNRAELGRLITEQLREEGVGPEAFARRFPEPAKRSVYGWMAGSFAPRNSSRAALEDALRWKRGSVTRILDSPITETLTLSEVKDWGQWADPAVARASELSDDELLMELTRRWGAMRVRLERLESE